MAFTAAFRNLTTLVTIAITAVLFANLVLSKFTLWQNRPTIECQSSQTPINGRICLLAAFVKLDAYDKILSWETLKNVKFAAIPTEVLHNELKARMSKSYAPDLIRSKQKNFFASTVQKIDQVKWYEPNEEGQVNFDLRFGDYWICGLNRSESIIEDADRVRCIKTTVKSEGSLPLLVQSQLIDPALSFHDLKNDDPNTPGKQWEVSDDLIEPLIADLLTQTTASFGYIVIDSDLASDVEVWPSNNARATIRLSTPLKKFKLRPGNYNVRLENLLSKKTQLKNFTVRERQVVSIQFDFKQLMKPNR